MGQRIRDQGRVALGALALIVFVLVTPRGADAFSLFPNVGGATLQDQLSRAARWSSVSGLDDGLQVGIAPGLAEALQVTGDAVAEVEQAVIDGFRAWENSTLEFDIALDAVGTVEGPGSGFEIDVFAVPATHPDFVANPQAFTGLTQPSIEFFDDRPFTNGQSSSG